MKNIFFTLLIAISITLYGQEKNILSYEKGETNVVAILTYRPRANAYTGGFDLTDSFLVLMQFTQMTKIQNTK